MQLTQIRPSTWALLVLAVILNVVLVLYPPGAAHILDSHFFYEPEFVPELFMGLGEAGRRSYFIHEFFDYGFLIVYTLILLRWRPARSRWGRRFALLPGALDIVENVVIQTLLLTYPKMSPILIGIVTVVTPLKWLSGVSYLINSLRLLRKKRNEPVG